LQTSTVGIFVVYRLIAAAVLIALVVTGVR
jgi:hypothetical protein